MKTGLYRTYADYLSERFDGKVQKLTVNAGFTCPNRDGTKGYGGCAYCNNSTFSPDTSDSNLSVSRQLEDAKKFFAKKYSSMRFLAYFQSYTNTHRSVDSLIGLYEEALNVDDVLGIIIGTRPDCVNEELMSRLGRLNQRARIIMEFGAESSHNTTLQRVNRCHTWEDTVNAVRLAKKHGLDVGLHFIMGLPGESEEMMLQTVDEVNRLDIDTIKFHQLQIVKGTRLAKEYEKGEGGATIFSAEDYLKLCCELVARLRPEIAIERFTSSSPSELLIAPAWGLKNYQFTNLLSNKLHALSISQGMKSGKI